MHDYKEATTTAAALPVVLCVDDEPHILSALRRLFRSQPFQLLTAESGAQGLAILHAQPVDLVISDMRMPIMNGAVFLEAVRTEWPNIKRLLLTGQADIQSILDAINRGEIYRYITKPWDDTEIILIVRRALEHHQLEAEQRRLEALTVQQNEALKTLNASLEEKVEARTAALKQAHDGLVKLNAKLKNNFLILVKIFSNMIELRGGNLAGHSLRVADLARKIAVRMGLNERDTHDVFIAAMLHNIGKIGLTDELLRLPITEMDSNQLGLFRKHPLRGEQLLMPLDELRAAATLVRSYQERFDGNGYPDRLAGLAIPAGARILAVASDYDNLQIGMLMARKLWPDEARGAILHGRGTRYDPQVADAFIQVLDGVQAQEMPQRAACRSTSGALKPGHILARDLITADGSLLLAADHVLDARLVQQIIEFEQSLAEPLAIFIDQE